MAATAGASGARAWLQTLHLPWLTPQVMKAITIGLIFVAFAISSVGLSGSTAPTHPAHGASAPVHARAAAQ